MNIKGIELKGLDPLWQIQTKILSRKRTSNSVYFLKDALDRVNERQIVSDEYKRLLATGGDVDNLHDVTIAAEKPIISLQLTLGIRNKVLEAYREIMRMQIQKNAVGNEVLRWERQYSK